MSADAQKCLFREVFGSDSEEDVKEAVSTCPTACVHGLTHVKQWLSFPQQEDLLVAVEAEQWFTGGANQAMRFGDFPNMGGRWTAQRRPLFDQLIVNLYQPGEGLKPHVDLLRFQDGIAIVSLQSSAILAFTRGEEVVDVRLDPGDLLLLEGEARYEWMHGITAIPREQLLEQTGELWPRISITLRKLI
ncbi:hypothetical protein CVIRNUC_000854 [Coccomyxa viridis]|uniref:Fe2OG dioxygenase domain-containing protein n=1 Tax=Coccomyxa viridis TaxID=1274662 RepID=A0AAV1HUB4_9CHLO|nr:hypothetical protein CVIRNUC_000854 [Coccomyxa viridis]